MDINGDHISGFIVGALVMVAFILLAEALVGEDRCKNMLNDIDEEFIYNILIKG